MPSAEWVNLSAACENVVAVFCAALVRPVNANQIALPTDNVRTTSQTVLTGSPTYSINSLSIDGGGVDDNSITWDKNTATANPKIIVGAGGILVNNVIGSFLSSGTEAPYTNAAVIGVTPTRGTSGQSGNTGPVSGSITAGPGSNYELTVTTANGANLHQHHGHDLDR